MLTRDDILNRLREQKPLLKDKFYVTEIGLFGSFARNEAHKNSDIDLLVSIDAPLDIYKKNKESLHQYLKKIFGKNVDIANPYSLKPHYKERILKQTIYA
ncbi:MAG: nucleotidyltransferase family protein [Flavobacterium sp.]